MARTKAKVVSGKLAFWESLMDISDKPARYLKYGDTVTILGDTQTYAGIFGDKAYYKVEHVLYGVGYMLAEGLEVSDNAQTK